MASNPPSDRRYLETHEWHKRDGDVVTIGITQFPADELTDITYVKLPAVGKHLDAKQSFGEIESVKTNSDLYVGISGTVTAVNGELDKKPELVNSDPFGQGWMIKLKPDNPADVDRLLSVDDYLKKTGH